MKKVIRSVCVLRPLTVDIASHIFILLSSQKEKNVYPTTYRLWDINYEHINYIANNSSIRPPMNE